MYGHLRRARAIAFATALELLSEPLCLLITLSALALSALAPAIHYHQFGEPSRMARDAGFSAVLLGGLFYVAFGAVRTYRREVESGTMETALAHSITRTGFFLSKFAGCVLAYLVFAITVVAVSLTVVNGAEIGGRIAALKCDVARLWGPSLAFALSAVIVPICLAAALNRFLRFRFLLTASLLSLVTALVGVGYRPDVALVARMLPAAVLFALPPVALLAAAAAFAVRYRTNVAASLTALAALVLVPALGNYCLSDALARGGVVPTGYFWLAALAIIPVVAGFLALGVNLINGKDAA